MNAPASPPASHAVSSSVAAGRLRICDVGLRDGLQNEKAPVSTADKLRLGAALIDAGMRELEITSFVNPHAVPQMADAEAMAAESRRWRDQGVRRTALVINEKGYARAKESGIEGIVIVAVISETLGKRNSNMGVADAIATTRRIIGAAKRDGLFVRACLAPAWVCPFEGEVPDARVYGAAEAVLAEIPDELVVADTIGHAAPRAVRDRCRRLLEMAGPERLVVHLHDTQALGMANAYAAMEAGASAFDASVGGLGGCPFAPGAAGNLATEDLVFLAAKLGLATGIDLDRLWSAVALAGELVGRKVGGRTSGYRAASAAREERLS
jgi:hydroxymethylglutaryl-CoA lyase